MIKYIKNKFDYLIGDWQNYTLEKRVYNAIILMSIIMFVLAFVQNLVIGFYFLALLTSIGLIIPIVLLMLSRFKNMYFQNGLFLSTNIILSWVYINGDGLKGSTLFFFFMTIAIYFMLIKTRHHLYLLILQIIIISSLFVFENLFPEMIKSPYKNYSDWQVDMIGSFAITIIFTVFFISFMRYSYEKEKELNENQRVEIEEQGRQRTMFFLNLTHEIKTPLTLISNYLEKYIETKGSDYQLQIVNNNIEKMKRDIIHFMNIEKLNKGINLYNQNATISLSDWVQHKIELFQPYAKNKFINLIANIHSNIGISIDPIALDHIINNLIDNAIKYTPKNGIVEITVMSDNDYAVFRVSDNGFGIANDKQEHIFEPFYQVSHAKQNSQGLGMGLFIVKKLIESVNGRLELDSSLGNGSSFAVYLPLITISSQEAVSPISSVSIPIPIKEITDTSFRTNKSTVLVVEDNPELLLFLKDELSIAHNVFVALNGVVALEKLAIIPKPNLIISDIMMDSMDGYAFIEHIKKNNELKDIPFIFLSAKSEVTDRIDGLHLGAIDYVAKPFSIKELNAKILSILSFQSATEETAMNEASKQIIMNLSKTQLSNTAINSIDIQLARFGITAREKEVFHLLLEGLKYEEIANKLFISERTIVRHVQNIYAKTNTNSRIDLVNKIKFG